MRIRTSSRGGDHPADASAVFAALLERRHARMYAKRWAYGISDGFEMLFHTMFTSCSACVKGCAWRCVRSFTSTWTPSTYRADQRFRKREFPRVLRGDQLGQITEQSSGNRVSRLNCDLTDMSFRCIRHCRSSAATKTMPDGSPEIAPDASCLRCLRRAASSTPPAWRRHIQPMRTRTWSRKLSQKYAAAPSASSGPSTCL